MTQMANLLLLSPGIQETLLHLSPALEASDPLTERRIRQFLITTHWSEQRKAFDAAVRS